MIISQQIARPELVIYDDNAFSHHATDLHGILMNAFDVVRIHKYGSLDEKSTKI